MVDFDRTGAAATNYGLKAKRDQGPPIEHSFGPLHVTDSSLYAADQTFGVVHTHYLHPDQLSALERFRAIRGFYFPLRTRLIWVWVDYR